MGSLVARHAYGVTIAALTAGICLLAGFLLLVALRDPGVQAAFQRPTPAPSATAAPTPGSAMALTPIAIQMPKDANCEACHLTAAGTVGTRPIPQLAHPLWGFRTCTACHADDGLVETAPGHSSLHAQDCLVCHQVNPELTAATSGAPMRPEHMGGDKACTSCHGVDEHAPLPVAMADRESCWICHNGPEFMHLFESASPDPSPGASPPAATGGATVGTRWGLIPP